MCITCDSASLRTAVVCFFVFVAPWTGGLTRGQTAEEPRVFLAITPIHQDREYEPGGDHRTQFLYLGQQLRLIIAIENITQNPISVETPGAWFQGLTFAISPAADGDPPTNISGPTRVVSPADWTVLHERGRVQSERGGEVMFEARTSDVITVSFTDKFVQTLAPGSHNLRVTLAAHLRGPNVNRQKAFEASVLLRIVDPRMSLTHSMEYAAQRAQAAMRARRLADARAAVEDLIALNPASVLGLTWLGDLAQLGGDCGSARTHYQAALSSLVEGRDRWSLKTNIDPVAAQRARLIQARLAKCG